MPHRDSHCLHQARVLLAITVLISKAVCPRSQLISEDCFCEYPETVNLTNTTQNNTIRYEFPEPWIPVQDDVEPFWVCAGGIRQYKCLRKIRRGRYSVSRGVASERLASARYCSPAGPPETCERQPQAGFSVQAGSIGAVNNLRLSVTCPALLNCTNASIFLSAVIDAPCEEGPNVDERSEEWTWVISAPSFTLRSPFYVAGWKERVRQPFAYIIDMDNDTLLTASPWRKSIELFHWQPDDTEKWQEQPVAEYSFPNESMWMQPVALFNTKPLAMSQDAILTQFEWNDVWDLSWSYEKRVAWEAKGQEVVLLPRSDEWGTESAVRLRGPYDKAGLGISGALSSNYAIVGTKYFDRVATIAGGAVIFERGVDGTWNPNHVAVIGAGYQTLAEFGHIVAISDGRQYSGIEIPPSALVAAPSAGTVHVFERGAGGWNTAATARLYRDAGDSAFPAGHGYPTSLAISGGFAMVSGIERAFLYVRRPNGDWTDAPLIVSGLTGADALFASTSAIADCGDGRGIAVFGALGEERAFLLEYDPDKGSWITMELSVEGAAKNPGGFGRSVAAGANTVAVSSDVKKVFFYTRQLIGIINKTDAMPFREGVVGPFDARKLEVGAQHKVCINLGQDEDDGQTWKETGLRIVLTWSERHASTYL